MSTRISSPNFIGRRAELEQARAALIRAADGEPGPILVSGEAGIGKSRLLGELAEWAGERDYRVLTGGCISLSAEVAPFAPIVQALRPLAHTLPPPELEAVLGPSRRALAPLLPGLIPAGVASGATGVSQDGSRERLLEQFLGLLHRLGTFSPVVLVIEDVHWADASTIDVMTFLARNLEADPIQLVTSFRTDEPHTGRTLMPFIAADEDQPRRGVARWPILRPGLQRAQAGLLKSFLGRIEIAEVAQQRPHCLGARGGQDRVDPADVGHAAGFRSTASWLSCNSATGRIS
jgi:hypothetical protein